MQNSKILYFILVTLIRRCSTIECFGFSESYTWSVNSVETSSSL